MVNTISKPQVKLLNDLQVERDTTEVDPFLEVLRQHYRENRATSKEASTIISGLLVAPKKSVLTVGVYEDSSTLLLYRVYLGQNSGQMLCKQVVIDSYSKELRYEYVGRADKHLANARRLTREEVAARTLAYGSTSCMVCGRRLDDPESVDRGIGPVCWENYS